MSQSDGRRGKVWGLVVAIVAEIPANIVALLITVEVARYSGLFNNKTHIPFAIAILAAQVVVVAALTWAVLYISFIRERAPRRAVAYFVILVVVGFISNGSLLGLAVYASTHRAVFFKHQDDADVNIALSEASQAEAIVVHHRVGSLTFHTGRLGAAGRITLAAKALVQTIAEINAGYFRRLRELEYPDFLTPDRLDNDPNFETTFKRLADVRATMLRREDDTDAAIAQYRQQIASVDIDGKVKHAALSRIDAEMAAEKELRVRETSLELSVVDEWKSIIIELRDERSRWHVDGEAIAFSDVSAEQLFRRHMRSLLAKQRELAALEKQ